MQAAHIVELLFDGFRDALSKGDRIEIRGFGSFVMRAYKTYMGRNPRTGIQFEVKPKSSTYFKVGKELKNRLNGSSS
jgi:integration host factor subunit beta